MESRAQYKLRLRNELSQVSSDIEELIVRTDRIAVEIRQGYDYIEAAILDKQAWEQAKFIESPMSGREVWDLVWDNVWDAVQEFYLKATTEIRQNYKELEPALRARQAALQQRLNISVMSGDEVWDEVWNAVWVEIWGVVEEFNREAAVEIKRFSEELKALFVKQAVLKAKLHELLVAGDEAWNVLKEVSSAGMK